MRITILNDGYRDCGGGLQLVKYANAMVRMGHRVTLAYNASFSYGLTEVLADTAYAPTLADHELPDADIVLCSTWYMARKVAALPLSKGEKCNILQGFEQWSGASEDIASCWRLPVYKIAPSSYIAEQVFLQTTLRCPVVPFGIDFEAFFPQPDRTVMDGSRLVVGALYNTSPNKRMHDLTAALEALHATGLPVSIELFGFQDRPDLPFPFDYLRRPSTDALRAMYNRCHVWLAMSDQEGLHVPPMEAMACGAVPVSSDMGGTRDTCLHGVTGLRVPIGGVTGAAEAVASLLEDPEAWARMSAASLAHIRSMGSEEDNVRRMLACFERVLAGRGAGRPGLFDLVNVYQTTWKTMAVYMDQAEAHAARGESGFALDLARGVLRLLEEQAQAGGGENLLSRHGGLYGRALALTGGRARRRARFSPGLEALREMARAEGGAAGSGVLEEYHNPAAFDGHLRIYPTLRCNLRCPYCVNEQVGPVDKGYAAVPPGDWAEAINREGRHVVLTGGEPFLYPGLTDLVNAVQRHLMVRVYTNLCLDLAEPLSRLEREALFFVSWHPRPGGEGEREAWRELFLANWRVIRDDPRLAAVVHAVRAPETEHLLPEDMEWFAARGLDIAVDEDQRGFAGTGRGTVSRAFCRRRIFLIAPDGSRYQCVSRLMRRCEPMENMLQGPLTGDACLTFCSDWGNCAPCDGLGETAMAVPVHQQEPEGGGRP